MADEKGTMMPSTKTKLGLMYDLGNQTTQQILGMGNFYSEYRRLLYACHNYNGSAPNVTIDGKKYINPIDMGGKIVQPNTPHRELMELLGWTDDDFRDYNYMLYQGGVQSVIYQWVPQFSYDQTSFDGMVTRAMSAIPDLKQIKITSRVKSYLKETPIEDRLPISIKQLNYGGYKDNITTRYNLTTTDKDWLGGTLPTGAFFSGGVIQLVPLDIDGEEIVLVTEDEREALHFIRSAIHNSLYDDNFLTSVSVEKMSEFEVVENVEDDPLVVIGYVVLAEEILDINPSAISFYDNGFDGMVEQMLWENEYDDEGYKIGTVLKNIYPNLIWSYGSRDSGWGGSINKDIRVYVAHPFGYYYVLRDDFEQCGNSNDVANLIFSAIDLQVNMEVTKKGFWRGLIRAVASLVAIYFTAGASAGISQMNIARVAIKMSAITAKQVMRQSFHSQQRAMQLQAQITDSILSVEDEEEEKDAQSSSTTDYDELYDYTSQYSLFNSYMPERIYGYAGKIDNSYLIEEK